MARLSRRSFLAGSAGLVVLAACGSDEAGDAAVATTAAAGAGAATQDLLVRFFPPDSVRAGLPLRLPFGLVDQDGALRPEGPEQLRVQVLDEAGAPVGEEVPVARRGEGLDRPYWPLEVTLPAGLYRAEADVDGERVGGGFQVLDGTSAVPGPGTPLPQLATPTSADPLGFASLCTKRPACPLHDLTLGQALAEGRPLAFLVATPAFCQTAVCGPVVDLLVEALGSRPAVRGLHLEVYVDEAGRQLAPAVEQLALTYEPVLFLVGADGVVRERLDAFFDRSEIAEALDRLVEA